MKCMNLKNGDTLVQVGLSDGRQGIVLTSQAGYACLYSEEEISILGIKAGGIKGMNLKNDELVSMNIFNPLKTDSYLLISDQPGIKRLRISDIPSCNRATKGNLVFKSPKTNQIHALTSFVLETQDQLVIETNNQNVTITVKDFAYGQLMNKPSLLTACKDEIINYIYNPKALSTDLYDLKIVKEETLDKPAIFEVEDDLNLFKQDDVKEKVEPQIVQQVQKESPKEEDDDKHFEPISFDDLFSGDF